MKSILPCLLWLSLFCFISCDADDMPTAGNLQGAEALSQLDFISSSALSDTNVLTQNPWCDSIALFDLESNLQTNSFDEPWLFSSTTPLLAKLLDPQGVYLNFQWTKSNQGRWLEISSQMDPSRLWGASKVWSTELRSNADSSELLWVRDSGDTVVLKWGKQWLDQWYLAQLKLNSANQAQGFLGQWIWRGYFPPERIPLLDLRKSTWMLDSGVCLTRDTNFIRPYLAWRITDTGLYHKTILTVQPEYLARGIRIGILNENISKIRAHETYDPRQWQALAPLLQKHQIQLTEVPILNSAPLDSTFRTLNAQDLWAKIKFQLDTTVDFSFHEGLVPQLFNKTGERLDTTQFWTKTLGLPYFDSILAWSKARHPHLHLSIVLPGTWTQTLPRKTFWRWLSKYQQDTSLSLVLIADLGNTNALDSTLNANLWNQIPRGVQIRLRGMKVELAAQAQKIILQECWKQKQCAGVTWVQPAFGLIPPTDSTNHLDTRFFGNHFEPLKTWFELRDLYRQSEALP